MDLSVVIPAYNEAHVIARTIEHVNEFFTRQHIQGEIITIDDGSTDATGDELAHLQKIIPVLRVISFPKNQGKGAACRAGFAASAGEWCIFMDADESTAIETWEFFKQFTAQYDIMIGSRSVIGARIIKRQNILKVLAGKLGNKWIKLVTKLPFNDTQCGFKAFHARTKSLLPYARVDGWAFDIEWLAISKHLGFRIKEIPVEWRNDTTSLVQPLDYPRVFIDAVKIGYRIIKIPLNS